MPAQMKQEGRAPGDDESRRRRATYGSGVDGRPDAAYLGFVDAVLGAVSVARTASTVARECSPSVTSER